MSNEHLFRTIKVSSFVSILLVVFIHANNLKAPITTTSLTFWSEDIISNGIARLAVPIFFIISGFLFFNNKEVAYPYFFINQFQKRLKSLLLPFVLWSLIGFLLFSGLQLIPYIKPIYNNFILSELTLQLFVEKWLVYPIPFQLWFLQILMACVVLAPILWMLISNNKLSTVFLPSLCAMWFIWGGYNGLHEYFFEGLLFFTLGAWITKYKSTLLNQFHYIQYFYVSFFILLLLKTSLIANDFGNISYPLGKLCILIGIPAFWHLMKYISSKQYIKKWILNYSFWIFLIHEPLLTFIKKGLFIVFQSAIFESSLIVYFLAPTIAIFLAIFSGRIISLTFPKIYAILTGGR